MMLPLISCRMLHALRAAAAIRVFHYLFVVFMDCHPTKWQCCDLQRANRIVETEHPFVRDTAKNLRVCVRDDDASPQPTFAVAARLAECCRRYLDCSCPHSSSRVVVARRVAGQERL